MMGLARIKALGRKAADLSPRGEVKGSGSPLSIWKDRRAAAAQEAAPSPDCAIWNDITRALATKPKASK